GRAGRCRGHEVGSDKRSSPGGRGVTGVQGLWLQRPRGESRSRTPTDTGRGFGACRGLQAGGGGKCFQRGGGAVGSFLPSVSRERPLIAREKCGRLGPTPSRSVGTGCHTRGACA